MRGGLTLRSLLVLAAFCALAAGSSSDAPGVGGKADGDTTPEVRDGVAQLERDTTGWRWRMDEGVSPLDDRPTVELVAREEWVEPEQADEPGSARLVVACREDRTTLRVETLHRFSPADQPERQRIYEVPVQLRIDDGPVQEQVWRETPDATGLLAPNPIRLARRLAGARRFRVRYTPHEAQPVTVIFAVSGLETRLGRVAETCHWEF